MRFQTNKNPMALAADLGVQHRTLPNPAGSDHDCPKLAGNKFNEILDLGIIRKHK